MTDFEKLIYNTHLKVSRVTKNKPYKNRINFDSIDEDKKFLCKKLAHFFSKHKNVNVNKFFYAPYKIYQDNPVLDLKFYTSLKACKLYFDYINKLNRNEISSQENKEFFMNSALFITKYCHKHSISWDSYINHKETKQDTLNSFFSHLKSGEVSVYMLFTFHSFDEQYRKADKEIINMMLKDVVGSIDNFRVKFYNCNEKTKEFFKKTIFHCKNKVDSMIG